MVSLDFMVAFSFYGVFRILGKQYAKTLATNFSPSFHLHCYRQIASIFTFISDYFVKLLLFKCLGSTETKNLHVRIVVPERQSSILRVTRRDVQLDNVL